MIKILIEGVSGVGKTTLARELAVKLGWTYLHGLYGTHHKGHVHPLTRLIFGRTAGVHDAIKSEIAKRIRQEWVDRELFPGHTCTDKDRNIIVDRWHPSAYVYHGDIDGDEQTFDASFLVVSDNPHDHKTMLYRTFFENNSKQYGYRGEIPSSDIFNKPEKLIERIREEVGL